MLCHIYLVMRARMTQIQENIQKYVQENIRGFFVMRARMTQIQENIRDDSESGTLGLAKSNKGFLVGEVRSLTRYTKFVPKIQV